MQAVAVGHWLQAVFRSAQGHRNSTQPWGHWNPGVRSRLGQRTIPLPGWPEGTPRPGGGAWSGLRMAGGGGAWRRSLRWSQVCAPSRLWVCTWASLCLPRDPSEQRGSRAAWGLPLSRLCAFLVPTRPLHPPVPPLQLPPSPCPKTVAALAAAQAAPPAPPALVLQLLLRRRWLVMAPLQARQRPQPGRVTLSQ